MRGVFEFLKGCVRQITSGDRAYWAWVSGLLLLVAVGVIAYSNQFREGLIATNMRDQVSWAFYVGDRKSVV